MTTVLVTPSHDAEALARLHASCFAESWSAEWIGRLLAQPGVFACLAEGNGGGFVLVRAAGGEAEILTLAVTPAARRRGIGSALIAAACGRAQEIGAETMFLEVSRTNEPAQALYRRLGFREVGRRRGYYNELGRSNEEALVFCVELPLPPMGNLERLD